MTIAADFRVEEDRAPRFVHLRSAGNEIPGRREILPAARLVEGGVDGQAIEIDGRAMWQLGRDDRAEALLAVIARSEEHTSELQSLAYLVCRLLLEKKKRNTNVSYHL